jgi:hypothetical protein
VRINPYDLYLRVERRFAAATNRDTSRHARLRSVRRSVPRASVSVGGTSTTPGGVETTGRRR